MHVKEQQTARVALLLVHDAQQVTDECFIAGWPMGRCSTSARARCTQPAPANIAHLLQNSAAACQQASAANDAQHATWPALYSTSFAPAHHPGGRCWFYRGKIPAHALHTCWCSPQLHSKPLLGGTAPRAPWRHAWHGIASRRQPMTRPALLALLLHNVQQVDVDDFDVFQRLVCPVRLGLSR
jgi:hypothetical protein